MTVKLDMNKAYDKVEWNYLQKLMEKMGFCTRWIELMMEYVSTISYSILTEAEPGGVEGGPLPPLAHPKKIVLIFDTIIFIFNF